MSWFGAAAVAVHSATRTSAASAVESPYRLATAAISRRRIDSERHHPPQFCAATDGPPGPQPEMRSPKQTARLLRERTGDWSAASHLPPIPMQKLLTEEKRHQPHAAQENPERHLMASQRNLRRSPCVPPGGRPGFTKHMLPPLQTFDPYSKNGPQ